MKSLILSITAALLIFASEANSQDRNPSTVYLELGGNALIYSINYDRLINDNFGVRGGIMGFAASSGNAGAFAIAVPVLANYLVGEGNSRLELGFGFMYLSGAVGGGDIIGEVSAISPTAFIGYRYQPAEGGFFFKIGFSPIMFKETTLPWGGLGIGYTL